MSADHADSVGDRQSARLEGVLEELTAIREEMLADATLLSARLEEVHANYRDSARNLMHYLAMRRRDLRPLQSRLATLGLSSLGRAESHVLANVDSLLEVVHRLLGRKWQPPAQPATQLDLATGQRLLAEHTDALLGCAVAGRDVRIMVTMPSEAAEDYTLVHDLLKQGMDCMRINCAHDNASAWSRMIEHLKRAEQTLGRSCRVVMDLAGPKLRTAALEPGPKVVRARPQRDAFGRVVAPARVWLTPASDPQLPPSRADARLTVPVDWFMRLQCGERIKLTDARDARRVLTIVDVADGGCWATTTKTCYFVPGTQLRHERAIAKGPDRQGAVGDMPPAKSAICLQAGDLLLLTRDAKPGRPAVVDCAGEILTPASIGCTIPTVLDDVRSGEAIWFDDGKIGGTIVSVDDRQAIVRITRARARGERLRSDKGINLPDSSLKLSALTAKDIGDLSFVAQHADIVELSFANTAKDVELLQQNLARQGKGQPAIVLKIETRRGFENLPEMLLMAMRSPCCGIMIARGDLAVECGFERLAEVQEEILWICEAAHVPVIWATQVLETLAKEGMPSRAEITDAAMANRAECVMLNKGPHVVSAVRVLDDILRRMGTHQTKKRAMLRKLRLARHLPSSGEAR